MQCPVSHIPSYPPSQNTHHTMHSASPRAGLHLPWLLRVARTSPTLSTRQLRPLPRVTRPLITVRSPPPLSRRLCHRRSCCRTMISTRFAVAGGLSAGERCSAWKGGGTRTGRRLHSQTHLPHGRGFSPKRTGHPESSWWQTTCIRACSTSTQAQAVQNGNFSIESPVSLPSPIEMGCSLRQLCVGKFARAFTRTRCAHTHTHTHDTTATHTHTHTRDTTATHTHTHTPQRHTHTHTHTHTAAPHCNDTHAHAHTHHLSRVPNQCADRWLQPANAFDEKH
jgi:hypothetical protein